MSDKKRIPLGEISPKLSIKKLKKNKNNGKSEINKLRLKFQNFTNEFIETLSNDGKFYDSAIKSLLNVQPEDFSEADPLLLIVPIAGNKNSYNYINGGNYGLDENIPGYLPWPGNKNSYILFIISSSIII